MHRIPHRAGRLCAAATATALCAAAALTAAPASADPQPRDDKEFFESLEQPAQNSSSTPPSEDPFYQPPDPLPEGEPGDIIRAEPAKAYADALRIREFEADVWRVMYLSTDAKGDPMAVTGTVMVPDAPYEGEGERPLVGYAIGTHGMADRCAPSYSLERGLDYEASLMEGLLNRGWSVMVTDYEGLGTPGDHTYMVGESQGHAVLDGLRAATRSPDVDIPADVPMGITGYSQGGGAAGWAAELAPVYAAELQLAGVAAGGVPADLEEVAQLLDGSLFFTFLGYSAIGMSEAYPELPFEEHLTPEGKELLDKARGTCLVDGLPQGAGKTMDELLEIDLLSTPPWQAKLEANRLGDAPPQVPMYMYHAAADEIVPYEQAAALREEYCAAGSTVQWHEVAIGEHATTLFTEAGKVRDWLADRFAGEPAPSNCPAG